MQFFLPEKCDDAIQSVPSVSHLVNTIFFPTGKKNKSLKGFTHQNLNLRRK